MLLGLCIVIDENKGDPYVKKDLVKFAPLTTLRETIYNKLMRRKKVSAETLKENLEETIFKTLSHQKRRDILRVIGEKKNATFTEIRNAMQTEDSPSLSYHLNALNGLIIQKEGEYKLSELGQDTYRLICKTASCATNHVTLSILRRELPLVIIANAILWAAAIFAVTQFEGDLHQMTMYSFAALWFISNIILYSLAIRTSNTRKCIATK